MNVNEDLAKRIVNLRESRNWTQKELADKLQFDKVKMNKIEHANRSVTPEELKQIASIFDVTTDYLLGNVDSRDDNVDITDGLEGHTIMTYQGKPIPEEDMELIKRILKGKE